MSTTTSKRTDAENALATANRMAAFAEVAAAWAAGEFTKITAAEAWKQGFEINEETALFFQSDRATAITDGTRKIEIIDIDCDGWEFDPIEGTVTRTTG